MQSGQVPVWVPIAAAALSIVGVLGGALVGAWREDRRWKREQGREDLRWQREKERDLQNHWREKRTDVYLEAIEVLQSWKTYGLRFRTRRDDETQRERARLWREVEKRAVEVMAKLALVGETSIVKNFSEIHHGYCDLGRLLTHDEPVAPEEWSDTAGYYDLCSTGLTHQIRVDLGIDPIFTAGMAPLFIGENIGEEFDTEEDFDEPRYRVL